MLESQIQAKISEQLQSAGWIVLRAITRSIRGYPDLEAFRDGRAIFIEVKRPGKKPTPLQKYRMNQLRKAGFSVYVMDSPDELKKHNLI